MGLVQNKIKRKKKLIIATVIQYIFTIMLVQWHKVIYKENQLNVLHILKCMK